METRQINGLIGAEISGIDLASELDEATIAAIGRALAEHGVVFFRDQDITPGQHDAFARRFGDPTTVKYAQTHAGNANMSIVSKEEEQIKNIGGGWHADQTYFEKPPFGAVLVARDLPAHGGDTLFSSMAAAYEALSEGLRATLNGLKAVHSNEKIIASGGGGRLNMAGAEVQRQVHPAVIRNPITGRKSLYVNKAYTTHFQGWTVAESEPLLNYLYAHGQQPEFQVRFHWLPGSVGFWDNSQVWHYAVNDYQGQRRVMHRIAVAGEGLIAA